MRRDKHREVIAAAVAEVIDRYCEEACIPEKCLAADLYVSPGHLSNIKHAVAPAPADFVLRLANHTGDLRAVEALCRLAGACCVALPEKSGDAAVLDLITDYTDAAHESAAALADGVVSADELERCEPKLHQAISAALRLSLCLRRFCGRSGDGRAGSLADAERLELTAHA